MNSSNSTDAGDWWTSALTSPSWSGESTTLTSSTFSWNGTTTSDLDLRLILTHIRRSFLPIVVAGTITNCLNFVVLSHREMRGFSTAVYLFALAIADLGVMYFELFRVWLEWTEISNPQAYFTDTYCRLVNYTNGIVRDYANWLIACLTTERLVMIASPYRARTLCTTGVAKTVSVVLLIVIAVPHVHSLIFSRPQVKIWYVCWEDEASPIAKPLAAAVEFIVGCTVIIVVFVLNMILIFFVYRNRIPSAPSSQSNLTSYKRRSHNKRLTRTLLVVAFVFLVCETPRMLMSFLFKFMEKTPIRRIFLNVSYVLSGLNHACNFFIYIVASPRFRQLLFERLPILERCLRMRSRRRSRRCADTAAVAGTAAAVGGGADGPGLMSENTQGDEETCGVQISLNVFVGPE